MKNSGIPIQFDTKKVNIKVCPEKVFFLHSTDITEKMQLYLEMLFMSSNANVLYNCDLYYNKSMCDL